MALHETEISWDNLNAETQEKILKEVVETLTIDAERDGKEQLKKDWYNPQPRTWQEAYIRSYAIQWRLWDSYEKRQPDAETPKSEDWQYWLEEHLTEEATKAVVRAIHDITVEIY